MLAWHSGKNSQYSHNVFCFQCKSTGIFFTIMDRKWVYFDMGKKFRALNLKHFLISHMSAVFNEYYVNHAKHTSDLFLQKN